MNYEEKHAKSNHLHSRPGLKNFYSAALFVSLILFFVIWLQGRPAEVEVFDAIQIWFAALLWFGILAVSLLKRKVATLKYKLVGWFLYLSGAFFAISTFAAVSPRRNPADPVISTTTLVLLTMTSSLVLLSGLSCLIKSSRFGLIIGGLSLLVWPLAAAIGNHSFLSPKIAVDPVFLFLFFGLFVTAVVIFLGLRTIFRKSEKPIGSPSDRAAESTAVSGVTGKKNSPQEVLPLIVLSLYLALFSYERSSDASIDELKDLGATIRTTFSYDESGKGTCTHVYLTGRKVTDADLHHLKGLASVELAVYLEGTLVTDRACLLLQDLKRLVRLDLENTSISDAGLLLLSGNTDLHTLSLKGTQITDTGLKHLSMLENLKELDLRSTQITDAGLVRLAGLPKLTGIFLGAVDLSRYAASV